MAQRRNRRQGSLLDNLPPELSLARSPERCTCRPCEPAMSGAQRAQHQAVARAWNQARKAWCKANGYGLAELLIAEHGRRAPSKRRPTSTTRPAPAGPGNRTTKEGTAP